MNGRITIIAITLCVTMVICCSRETIYDPPPGFFVGVVTDKATAEPIDSAVIHIKLEPDSSCKDYTYIYTTSDGYYNQSAAHRKGRFHLFASKVNYITKMAEVDLVGDSVRADFELEEE